MQNTQILTVATCLMVVGAAAVQYFTPRLAIAQPRRLPVETFPAAFAGWQGGDPEPVDPDIQRRLPTARIEDRDYSHAGLANVDLTLVSASDNTDIHDPNSCFPSQGWKLTNRHEIEIAGQKVNVMDASLDDQDLRVYYYDTGYYPPPTPSSALVRGIAHLRERIVGRKRSLSLFVRMMAPATPDGDMALSKFVVDSRPAVFGLLQAAQSPAERNSDQPIAATV